MKKKAALHNLGCKVNAYETEAMQELLEQNGYEIVPFKEGADVYIINTCTVTNIADRKSRQMLHKARKMNPDAVVVATGCYVQARGEDIDPCVDIVVGNNKKKDLIAILDEYYNAQHKVKKELIDINHEKEYEEMQVTHTAEHTRAYIKVQDGCNQFCSYCIIPYARGRVRSLPVEQALDALCSLDERFCAGELSVSELVSQAVSAVRGVEDHLIFDHGVASSRSRAFERVVGAVLADAGSSYGIELSRKVAFLLAQEICLQLWPGIGLAKRKSACAEQISHLLGAVTSELPFASSVSDQVAADVEGALGISLDHFTKTLLTLCVASESRDAKALRTLCVILSHGYSTATSIADAANRMLGMHVYEAVDMPYDQQLKDIVGPLQRLVDRHSYCTGVVFLVDMGSLEEAYKALENVTDSTIGVVNNVSTGLALEIGVGLLGGKSIAEVLGDATAACVTHCKVIERVNREDAIVFCSESGVDAAERIRQLVSQSLPRTIGARLLTRPFKQLVANGSNDAVFSEHRVCAVIGTGDPGVASVPFVALEDIMSTASASKVDAVFGRWLDASELSSFHEKLLSNMTLQNVIRSITILDPERLFHEIESAVHELQRRTGEKIGSNAIIGLYVHLCCLVERLVTRNPIETYVGQDRFEEERADFIESFRQSFSSISTRYRVEVPVSEIAYVFDYISVSAAPAREERLGSSDLLLDE